MIQVRGASAQVIEDSVAKGCPRLTTLQLRYPRMVHAEAKTHRMLGKWAGAAWIEDDCSLMGDGNLSRNGRSSRAVPTERLLSEAPYVPHFMKNQKGMQATEEFSSRELETIVSGWSHEAQRSKDFARQLHAWGVHKQWANRPVEWHGFIDVLVTATEDHWPNFFGLRLHSAAQPEMQDLALAMKKALDASLPRRLPYDGWHLPYASGAERLALGGQSPQLRVYSVARCARLSVRPFDGDDTYEAEERRYKILVESQPLHASPAEHLATPDPDGRVPRSNLTGWGQFRKMLPGEVIT